ERGLRELSLIPVSEVPLLRCCELAPDASSSDALTAMDREGVDWALLIDGDRCVGWLDRDRLKEGTTDLSAVAAPLTRWITPSQTLREALEVALTSHTRVAIVQEDGRYRGVLPIERIAARLEDQS